MIRYRGLPIKSVCGGGSQFGRRAGGIGRSGDLANGCLHMQANSGANQEQSLFWMVPQPVRWAAGGIANTLGGFINNFNPWRAEASLATPAAEEASEEDEEGAQVCSLLRFGGR